MTPKGLPFTVTSARFFTSPRSSQRCEPLPNQSAGARMVFVYVPTPEKYLIPASVESGQEMSLSSVAEGGAPRSASKLTFHGPSTSATLDSVIFGRVCEVSLVVLRKTTNTVPHGSRCRGTVVRPSAILNEAGFDVPVSAYQSSGAFPVTRNVASTVSSRSLRLSMK